MKPTRRDALFMISFLLNTVLGINGREWETPPAIPPDAGGIQYPENDSTFAPPTPFECRGKKEGHYGDKNYGCVVFHYCSKAGKKYSYKCQEGKKFDELSSSCVYFLGEECKSSGKIKEENGRDSSEREGKFSFPQFSRVPTTKTIEDALIPSEGLDTLAAFASLARTDQKSLANFQNGALKNSGNSDSNYSRASNHFLSAQKKKLESHDEISDDSVDRIIQGSDTEYYEDSDSDLNEASNQQPYQTNTYSFFPPPAHVQNAFNSVRETVNSPVFNFASSQARQKPNNLQEIRNPPVSHVHFTPPGFRTSPIHAFSSSKNTNGNSQSFHSTVSSKSPEPPSVFGSPSPKTFENSSPSLKDIYRTGYEKDEYSTPHYFDYYSGYNKPLSTPAYYDDINYDIPSHFNNPAKFNSPVYVSNANPNVERYQLPAPKVGPQKPFLPSALRVQKPQSFIKHNNYVHSNIKTNIPNEENAYHELPKVLLGHSFVNTPVIKSQFVTRNPVIHVTTISPKFNQPNTFLEPTHVLHDSVIDEPIQGYPTPSPPSHGEFTGAVRRPSKQKANAVRTKEIDITTYSPRYIPKVIENIVEEEEEEEEEYQPEEKPKKQISASRLPSTRQRPNRRPTPSSRIRSSTVVEKLEPSTDLVEEKESYEIILEEEEPDEIPIDDVITQPITTTTHLTTTKIPPTQSPKPTRPSLKGSLKDRLNRLGTRRRTLNQSTQSQIPDSAVKTKENVNAPIPSVRKPTLKRPVSKIDGQNEKTEEISPSDEKKLKGRITNYFKEGSTSRNRSPPRRAPLKRKTEKERVSDTVETKNVDSTDINQPKENIEDVNSKTSDKSDSVTESDDVSHLSHETSIDSVALDQEAYYDEPITNRNKHDEDNVTSSPVSESYDEIPIEEAKTITSELSKESKPGRKRTMNPDVRARFKEFLKNRRNGSNNKKRLRSQNKKETSRSENAENAGSSKKSSLQNEKEADNTVNESEIFEESIPLFREEKIIALPEEQITINEVTIKNKSRFNLRENLAGSGVISSKPLRYELSKLDKTTTTSSDVTDVPNTTTYRVINYNDNKYSRRKFPTNPGKVAPTSITTHTVVRPIFKQIVKMSPRHPELISQATDIISTTESESIIVRTLPEKYENEEKSPEMLSEMEDKLGGLELANDAESTTQSEVENQFARKVILREKPVMDKLPGSYEHSVFDSVKKVIGNYNDSKFPQPEDHKERTKPVFNLDTLSNIHKITSEDSHISALNPKLPSGKTSTVNFEPFPIDSDSPFLPIELLLRGT